MRYKRNHERENERNPHFPAQRNYLGPVRPPARTVVLDKSNTFEDLMEMNVMKRKRDNQEHNPVP